MQKTSIEYLDYTWNPLALRMADRLAKNPSLSDGQRLSYAGNQSPVLIDKELGAPLDLRKPSRIGVQFMGDLFYEFVADSDCDAIFEVMRRCQRHTFLVLTKRIDLAAIYLQGLYKRPGKDFRRWVLPNVWPGVTIENQARANERIPILLQIPAEKRFVSIEPMLGPVDLYPYFPHFDSCPEEREDPEHGCEGCDGSGRGDCQARLTSGLSWVILGGETGTGARPMHLDWVRSVRDQCQAAGVPFFFKGWGDWARTDAVPGGDLGGDMRRDIVRIVKASGENDGHFRKGDALMRRVGKKAAGHLLDGRAWHEMPGVYK